MLKFDINHMILDYKCYILKVLTFQFGPEKIITQQNLNNEISINVIHKQIVIPMREFLFRLLLHF